MAYDDYLYLGIILSTIPFGFGLKAVKASNVDSSTRLRYLYCLVVGCLLALLGMREQIWHSCLVIVGNYFILCIFSFRYSPIISFVFNFGYLLFFRSMHYFGFAAFTGPTNAVQLILTLKMISLAFDGRSSGKPYALLPYLSYSFCFFGLFSGPFFRFQTFTDTITNPRSGQIETLRPCLSRLKYVPLYTATHLVLQYYFPLEYLLQDGFLNHPWGVLYRLAYLHPLLLWYRFRFYIAWKIAVAGCIAGGLGAYPIASKPRPGLGPTVEAHSKEPAVKSSELDFTTVHQLRVWQIETITAAADGIPHWNMTIQFWMYHYVARQVPWRKYRRFAVFLVGAYWHGLRIGYYVSFILMLTWMLAQDSFTRITRRLRPPALSLLWRCVDWFVTWNIFCYHIPAFRLLTLGSMWTSWASVYFVGHFWCFICIFLGFFSPSKPKEV